MEIEKTIRREFSSVICQPIFDLLFFVQNRSHKQKREDRVTATNSSLTFDPVITREEKQLSKRD